ncbi:DUF2851 family protein [Salinimicrobium soli]|uniref:DUF2851 family protein n=1 Tax=Salinimicrobium soli TaxID=1254399 RepID=UPI003AB01674
MQEDYLHYLWEFQKWKHSELLSSKGIPVQVISPGNHNHLSGPDFFNSRLLIGEQEWAGNVEIHLRASDWYLHGHETDPAYDNVILHVVWEHDAEIFRRDNSVVPVLELKNLVPESALAGYRHLIEGNLRWINCEPDFSTFDDFILDNWLERLFFERLEEKSRFIQTLLEKAAGDWEEVLYQLLFKNFGLNINGEAFFSIAASIPFQVVRKCGVQRQKLEALFFGQAGMLEKEVQEPYFLELKKEYEYLRKKFDLKREGIIPVRHFRLRPDNFPELRLAQLASVYHSKSSLFQQVIKAENSTDLKNLFSSGPSDFWRSHYTFEKAHSQRKKQPTSAFLDLLVINTLVPLQFTYFRSLGKDIEDRLLEIMQSLKAEDNSVIKKYNMLRPGSAENALRSQALLQLKKEYCDQKRCLHCALGVNLLKNQQQV